ncbi:MAG: hypothetical protein U9Q92_02655 [archaeon]|nr:hypothetical protein [archaeon]
MKSKLYLVIILVLLILISGCIQLEKEKQVNESKHEPAIEEQPLTPSKPTFTPPEDIFPSEVQGIVKYLELSRIGPISSDECSKYIENEPDRTICYFVLAIKNKDKEPCSFVKNYAIVEGGCTCLGAGHGGCCERVFNWTLNKDRCTSIVEGETFYCPFTLGSRCKYDKFKESYYLSDEQIKLSREFGILCRNEDCLLSIAKNQITNRNKAKEICDSMNANLKSICYEEIAPLIAVSDFDFALDLCQSIPKESSYYDTVTVDCYSAVAASVASTDINKSIELCEFVFSYPENNVPNICYWRVAWALPKEEMIKICNRYIPTGEDRDWCLRRYN